MFHRSRRAITVTLLVGVTSLIVHQACSDALGPLADLTCELQLHFPYGQPILLVGDTGRLFVVFRGETGAIVVPDGEALWSSSDPRVASVDATGLVTALEPGAVVVDNNRCGGFAVAVASRPARLVVAPDTLQVARGNRGLVGVGFLDSAGRLLDDEALPVVVAWRSADLRVASVTYYQGQPGAQVTAIAEGAVAIVVSLSDLADTMVVVVAPVTLGPPEVGAVHSCAPSGDGRLYCWGSIQLEIVPYGPGSVWGPAPAVMATPLRFASLSSGANHMCGITADDALYCMGANDAGQVGVGVDGPVVGPARVKPGTGFRSVTAGSGHTCALTLNGQLFCWGLNDAGQLGAATPGGGCTNFIPKSEPLPVDCSRVPVPAAPGLAFGSVRAGSGLTCGLTTGDDLYCWGLPYGPDPVRVGDGLGLVSFDVGGNSGASYEVRRSWACGLDAVGAAYCWGSNPGGLGDGATTESAVPVPVAGGLTFRGLSVGGAACGLSLAGAIYCWGGSYSFALSAVPTQVPGAIALETISVGLSHACGTAGDGRVYCWGSNNDGQLGAAGVAESLTPILVAGQR